MVLSKKKKAVFSGKKEIAQINCTCKERVGQNLSRDCDCSVIVEKKKGKVTPKGIVGGESVVVQLDVPFLQHFVEK